MASMEWGFCGIHVASALDIGQARRTHRVVTVVPFPTYEKALPPPVSGAGAGMNLSHHPPLTTSRWRRPLLPLGGERHLSRVCEKESR